MKLLAALLLLVSSHLSAATLLFVNKIPAETDTPEYMAGVLAIHDTIANGGRIHVTMTSPQNGSNALFYANVSASAVSIAGSGPYAGQPYYVSGIFEMRPHINNMGQAIAASPLTSGSVDTYGQYFYNGTIQTFYTIYWWAD